MTILNSENTCDRCIERLIDRQPLSEECQKHVIACANCKSIINTIGAIALQGSTYTEDYNALKLRLMKKLVPLVAKPDIQVDNSSLFIQIRPWLLSFTVVGVMLLMFSIFNPTITQHQVDTHKLKNIASIAHFKIALNNEAEKSVSLDEPIALSDTDTAQITIPDGSILEVKGPARLNINPRGFHLVTGFVIAKVKKGKTPFISTTPQGQIRVLGTVYDCLVAKGRTTVSLKRGSVKVIPDYGSPVVLKPGEKTSFSSAPDKMAETEIIPPIDSE